jgi:hypothetical protein
MDGEELLRVMWYVGAAVAILWVATMIWLWRQGGVDDDDEG